MIESALKTWYPPDSEHYKSVKHPALKLAGEAGELLDLYAKHLYKPGFNAFACKHCGEVDHNNDLTCFDWYQNQERTLKYTSKILDELGDFWYYLRILYFIKGLEPTTASWVPNNDLCYNITKCNVSAAYLAAEVVEHGDFDPGWLSFCYRYFTIICEELKITEEELTFLNWEKLNVKGAHGWKPDYKGEKVG